MSSHRNTQLWRQEKIQDTKIFLAQSQIKKIKSKNSAVDLVKDKFQLLAFFSISFFKNKYATYTENMGFKIQLSFVFFGFEPRQYSKPTVHEYKGRQMSSLLARILE